MLDHVLTTAVGRRRLLSLAGAAALPLPRASAATPAALDDPQFNVEAFARLSATLEPGKTGYVHYWGKAFGIDPGGEVTPFYGIDGVGALKALPQPGGAIRFLFAECAIYTDLKTGAPLETWINPWTQATVPVWHQRNGPVNYEISAGPSAKVGAFERAEGGAPPFRLPWSVKGDRAMFALDVASKRPNPLDPALYPEESTGPVLLISEHSEYMVSLKDLLDPTIKSLQFFGALQSLKPWHPWMKLGTRPGKVFTRMLSEKVAGPEALEPRVFAYAQKHLPQYLVAPETWTGEYKSAYDLYKAEFPRKPS
jgi:hypothetical protein